MVEGFAACAECGEQLEFAMDAEDMARTLRAAEPETWVEADCQMGMRPANSNDLAASMEAASDEDARALLLAKDIGYGGHGPGSSDADRLGRSVRPDQRFG